MSPKEALKQLKEFSHHLRDIEYYEILSLLHQIGRLPLAEAKLKAGAKIDRARPNIGECLFTRLDQVSYITDPLVIRERMTEFGRANKPHDVMFYGAVESTLIDRQRITAIAEISELYQDKAANNIAGKLYTVSRWGTRKDLMVAEMIFSTEALRVNPDTQRSFRQQIENLRNEVSGEELDFQLEVMRFISDEFAREKASHHDYKISAGYTDYAVNIGGLQGVAYPSVQTKFRGQNVVFPTGVVDDAIALESIGVLRLHKFNGRLIINNYKNCANPSECLSNFTWSDPASKDVYTIGELADQLGVEASTLKVSDKID